MTQNIDISGYELLGIGGAHNDRIGRTTGAHRSGVSNPGNLHATVGGGVVNALRNARLRGVVNVAIISARGGDIDGLAVEKAIVDAGIADLSGVFLDRRTASYTAILDHDGELVSGLADMGIYEEALPRQLRRHNVGNAMASAHCLLIDANLPEKALELVAAAHPGPLNAIAVSPAKAPRLFAVADRLGTVFMNRNELAVLTGAFEHRTALHTLRKRGIGRAVVTAGADTVAVLDGTKVTKIRVPAITPVRDVTGAGDALAGATLARLATDPQTPLTEAVRDGIAAAGLTIQADGPLAGSLTGPAFEAIRAQTAIVEEN